MPMQTCRQQACGATWKPHMIATIRHQHPTLPSSFFKRLEYEAKGKRDGRRVREGL